MSRLSLYLPSFAADYSGACSVLFDLDFLVVLADAKCCTRNYVNYDEPRWTREKETTLCAQLRMLDVVLGDEEKLIDRIVEAARDSRPRGIALLGSPVSALTGMDMRALAAEVEAACGTATLGIPTTGFDTYERGVQRASEALFKRFCSSESGSAAMGEPSDDAGALPADKEGERPRVNVLGLTPLDFADPAMGELLQAYLRRAGFAPSVMWSSGYCVEDLPRTAAADVNLVVSAGGLGLAQRMEKASGIPWVAALPYGNQGTPVAERLWKAVGSAPSNSGAPIEGVPLSAALSGLADGEPAASALTVDFTEACHHALPTGVGPVLIVGDWVAAVSQREMLRTCGWQGPITVASFFGKRPPWAEEGDRFLSGERDLHELARAQGIALGVGDPLLQRIPSLAGLPWVAVTHPAISSDLYR